MEDVQNWPLTGFSKNLQNSHEMESPLLFSYKVFLYRFFFYHGFSRFGNEDVLCKFVDIVADTRENTIFLLAEISKKGDQVLFNFLPFSQIESALFEDFFSNITTNLQNLQIFARFDIIDMYFKREIRENFHNFISFRIFYFSIFIYHSVKGG